MAGVKYWRFWSIYLWGLLIVFTAWWIFFQPSGWWSPMMFTYLILLDYVHHRGRKKRLENFVKERENAFRL